ncbi:hypothetical protein CEXT_731381 [Caerostris extrusa]|uniref:Uncharacterized protein n=1 Tax=Caerostris extrusa TaxID=172846 RepID=A0AAV4PDW8_CAEEX|nr:hypothetical protein CEXT_731381 [Caerostris extrusa]
MDRICVLLYPGHIITGLPPMYALGKAESTANSPYNNSKPRRQIYRPPIKKGVTYEFIWPSTRSWVNFLQENEFMAFYSIRHFVAST